MGVCKPESTTTTTTIRIEDFHMQFDIQLDLLHMKFLY